MLEVFLKKIYKNLRKIINNEKILRKIVNNEILIIFNNILQNKYIKIKCVI